ncbi:MAG: glycosyltransferase [Ardenticatenaceae bacterium]
MAKYLTQFGHEVRVISAREQDISLVSLPLEIPSEHVTYTRWLNPLWLISKVYGRGQVVPWSDQLTTQSSSRMWKIRRETLRAIRSLLYFPDKQIGWLPFALSEVSHQFKNWTPDVIYASASPVTSLIVAHMLARRHAIPWVGELRDLWVDNQYYQYPGWRKRVEEKLERRVLSSAIGLVTVSQPLADTLQTKFGKPTAVILNGFDPADNADQSETAFKHDGLRIVYTGKIYAGRQTPAPLFEALRRLDNYAEKVRVAFYGASRDLVRKIANDYGVEKQVEINDSVPHHQALKAQREADVLLHLLWNDPKQPGVYNAKVFEYLGARRPILAVGYTGNVTAQLVGKREAGLATDDPILIADQLEKWIKQKEQLGSIRSLTSSVTIGLSREEQARELERFLVQLLTKP